MNKQLLLNIVYGALAGDFLGTTRRGPAEFRALPDHVPIPAEMQPNESLDAWLVWTEHLRSAGLPEGVAETRSRYLRLRRLESAFGNDLLAKGIRAPMSGSFRNPVATSASVWLRPLFWGLALPPHEAVNYAYWDVETDQAADNATICAAIAAAASAENPLEWYQRMKGLTERVPKARACLTLVADQFMAGASPAQVHVAVVLACDAADPFDASLNLGFLTIGILMGASEFEKTVGLAVACGGASDAVGSVAGAMAAKWYGIPENWKSALGESYFPSGTLHVIESPRTISEFVETCFLVEDPIATAPDEPEAPESTVQQGQEVIDESTGYATTVPPPLPVEPPSIPRELITIPCANSSDSVVAEGDLIVRVTFEDLPLRQPDQTVRIIITFENFGEERTLTPNLRAPQGWMVASRLTKFRIAKGAKASFPVVIQPGEVIDTVILEWETGQLPITLLAPHRWYVCGPFENNDGMGFDRTSKCENVLRTSELFVSRGNSTTKWRARDFAGVAYDTEPYFSGSPGVIYLWGRIEFAESGQISVVAAGSPGVIVKVNHETVVRYHHTHRPIRRPMKPYLGTFQALGPVDVLVKLVRGQQPITPLSLYFLSADGRVLYPQTFQPMPE